MTSIDELFNKSGLASNKRKSESLQDPNKSYKAAKISANGDVKYKPSVQEASEEDEDESVAGPDLPPDEDQDNTQDDEEGRFYGGGVSRNTAEVLDFIDQRDEENATQEKIDAAWLRRIAVSFERRISKNSELRAKFEQEPQKFVASEADLDADIKSLSILSEHPELYEDFAKLGCVGSLVSLLAHENTDIAIDAIEIISELTDEDVEAEQKQWDSIVDAMLDADLASLLVQNLERLDETSEADRTGVYHSLSVLENLASQSAIAEKVCESSTLVSWLLGRMQRQEAKVSQNKQYAAEILSIFLQTPTSIRNTVISQDAIDLLLQLLAAFRKRDPEKDSEEEEYAENVFDALTCLVEIDEGKQKFVDAEGIELMLIMLREAKFGKPRALRLLDHAMSGIGGISVCEKFVEAAGLKTIFGLFMKHMDHSTTEHILGIFSSLLRSLPGDSPQRIRTLAKFMEKDYEKVKKLAKLRIEYKQRLSPIDQAIKSEQATMSLEEQEQIVDEWLSRRLDAGLFCAQTLDVILAWLVAEDDGARMETLKLLGDHNETFDDIVLSLNEQLAGFDSTRDLATEEQNNAADMLRTLVDCLN